MTPTNEHPTQPTTPSTRRLPCSGRVVACVESRELCGRAEQLGAWPFLSSRTATAMAHRVWPLAANPPARYLDAGAIDIRRPDLLRAAEPCLALRGRLRHHTGQPPAPSRGASRPRGLSSRRQHGSRRNGAMQRSGGSRAQGGALGAPIAGSPADLAGRMAAVVAWPGRGLRFAADRAAASALWCDAAAPFTGGIHYPPYTPAARYVRSHRTIRNQHEARNSDQRRPAGGVPDRHP
jgi:hypothetical protein